MRDVGIVIVTYNSASEIGACLDAAMSTGAEVIVVDNASTDGTLELVRQRRGAALVANPVNRGFAAAVNQGIRLVTADYILLLNPDAVLKGSLKPLRAACAVPGAGAAGGKLVDFQGAVQAGFSVRRLPTPVVLAFEVLLVNRLWPGNPANCHYRCYDLKYDEPAEVEQPAGAFLMIRRQVWEELGGLDEQFYPIWFEDVDFCKRLRDRGYHVYFEPDAVAAHRGGHSIRKILLENRELYWYGSLLKYAFKHFHSGASRLLCLAVLVGSLMRMAMGIVLQRSPRPILAYGRVMRLAGRYFLFGPGKMGVPSFS
jgi:N-acetylglucosaminyl-diphospho-decaprenol L-rhamnosyltransferase